jgi:hypothetical protein
MIVTKMVKNYQDYYLTKEKENPISTTFIDIYKKQEWSQFSHYVGWLHF